MRFSNDDIVILDEDSLQVYQTAILNIAEDVISVCDLNQIDYCLTGGSVLGAIRHKGFIPWDDDIDIDMPRASYDRFVKLFNEKLGDRYYLQTPQNDPELGLMVTQVRKTGTVARRKYDWNQARCGLSIDIYIVENVFSNPIARFIQQNMSMACSFAISAIRFTHNKDLPEEIKVLEGRKIKYSRLKSFVGKVFGVISLRKWIQWCDFWNSLCKDNESSIVAVPTGRKHFSGETYSRNKMCRYKKVPFVTEQFNVPVWAEGYLNFFYGDYMQLPPKEKRERHLFLELKF